MACDISLPRQGHGYDKKKKTKILVEYIISSCITNCFPIKQIVAEIESDWENNN